MSYWVRFQDIDDVTWENISADTVIDVKAYSHTVYGSPKQASIEISGGNEVGRFGFSYLIGKGIIITNNETAEDVWWGVAREITITQEYIKYIYSTDNLANKIAVAYSYLGERFTTDWSSDTASINTYGTYELLIPESDISPTAAETRRDLELALRKAPIPQIQISSSPMTPGIKIECDGWFETLKRRYWIQEEGYEAYTDSGSGDINVGDNNTQYVAQSFQLSSSTGWDMIKVDFRIRLEESPTDNLEVQLRSGASIGSSSLVATSGTVPYSDITDSMDWITFTFSASQTLSTGTTYWLQVQRTGGQDGTNYYVLDGNEDVGYALGELQAYTGSWAAPDPPLDATFRIYGEKETTEQINDILTDTVYFLATPNIDIKDASGVYTNQYKDDYVIAYDEMVDLLEIGDSSGNRLFLTVSKGRDIFVYAESNAKTYILQRNGKLLDASMESLALPGECVFGCWVDLSQALPDVVNQAENVVTRIFVDEAEIQRGFWKPVKTRGIYDTFDALGGNLLK